MARGKWVWFEETRGNPIDGQDYDWGWKCSECGKVLPNDYDDPHEMPKINFCDTCGADMRKSKSRKKPYAVVKLNRKGEQAYLDARHRREPLDYKEMLRIKKATILKRFKDIGDAEAYCYDECLDACQCQVVQLD